MSGFAGMISTSGAAPDRELLEKMTQKLEFRGPDAKQITIQAGAGFGFTLLRTGPAPQAETQPYSVDGRVWLLGDVRLDGREDLRRKLEHAGEPLSREATDEELLLRTWRQWGEKGLAELSGDYSFGFWDATRRELLCLRDVMGVRPLFYAEANGWLYFSNTLEAIRCVADISSELDEHYIGDFLLEGWCSQAARTAFRKISRLPAGHVLRYANGAVEVSKFVSLPIEEPLALKRDEEYVEQFRELLEGAVSERLPRGNAAIFMSGGLDSTSIAAVAVAVAKRNGAPLALRAYTADWSELFDDPEGKLAERAAKFIGIPIEVQSGNAYRPFAGGDGLDSSEPCLMPYRSMYAAQISSAAKHARVIFTGFGGDGVMTGQSWPYIVDLSRRRQFATIAKKIGGYLAGHGKIPPLRGGFRNKVHSLFRAPNAMQGYPSWLNREFEGRARTRERWLELRRQPEKVHPWYPDTFATLTSAFWSSVFEREDAVWTGRAMESRSPLLDQRIIRFLLRVPPVPLCIDKELLKRTVEGMLPEEIRLRRKMPLAGDPIKAQIRTGKWHPEEAKFAGAILNYVDGAKMALRLENSAQLSWAELPAISLLYFLERLEGVPRLH